MFSFSCYIWGLILFTYYMKSSAVFEHVFNVSIDKHGIYWQIDIWLLSRLLTYKKSPINYHFDRLKFVSWHIDKLVDKAHQWILQKMFVFKYWNVNLFKFFIKFVKLPIELKKHFHNSLIFIYQLKTFF